MCLTRLAVGKAIMVLAQEIQAESLQLVFVTQWVD